jgi:membrane-bound serine protease (ClpP class)
MAIVRAVLFWAAVALLPSAALAAEPTNAARAIPLIAVDGPIGPATARHVKEALAAAAARRAEVVILRLNTPGGLATSMREIIADILASPVPVAGYVAPSGAHAASAGTYILYAAHIAAMAPGTNIGAATPVQIGGVPGLPGESDRDKKDDKPPASPTAPKDAASAKATNDAIAFIRSLAEMRRRNPEWAEKAVRDAATLSAQAALQERVIDLVARDASDLVERLDGRTVEIAGASRRLATKGLATETIEPRWLIRLLGVITNPNVALILLLVGMYGLVFEFMNPGFVAPGVIGGIALVLGLYALNLLPIDYTGLALLLLGLAFLVAEAITPSFGAFGFGGIVAFLLGAAMLIDTEVPGFRLSWTVVGAAALASAAFLTLLLGAVARSRRGPARVGAVAMLGLPVRVLDWSGGAGHVLAEGERWQARGDRALAPGDIAEVEGVSGLTLTVRRRPMPTAGDRR